MAVPKHGIKDMNPGTLLVELKLIKLNIIKKKPKKEKIFLLFSKNLIFFSVKKMNAPIENSNNLNGIKKKLTFLPIYKTDSVRDKTNIIKSNIFK